MKEKIIRIDLNGVNCYLAESNEEFVLFDTGGPTFMDKLFNDRCKQLMNELEKAGCVPGKLRLVVLTHGDIDHVFNAAYIRYKYDAKIAMHTGDLPFVEEPSIQSILKNAQYRSIMLKAVSKVMQKFMLRFSSNALTNFKKFTPDILIDDSFSLLNYGLDAEIIHIPGHTDGSIGILFQDGSFISGDTYANMDKPNIAPNACDFTAMDLSIEKLNNYEINTVFPGHGAPFNRKDLKR